MVVIVGAGAVGTALGYFLAAGGAEVTFMLRESSHVKYAAADALKLSYVEGLMPSSSTPDLPAPSLVTELADVDYAPKYLLLCVKQQQLEVVAAELIDLPTSCTIVPCMNGVRHIAWLAERFPQHTIAPMVVNFNMRLQDVMDVLVTTKPQLYGYGELTQSALAQFLNAGGNGVMDFLDGDLAVSWGKLLINLNNAVGALTNSTFKDIFLQPMVRNIYLALLQEAVGVLREQDIAFRLPGPFPFGVQRRVMRHFPQLAWQMAYRRNGLTDQSYPSMREDLRLGRPTEVDFINGEIVRLAGSGGVPGGALDSAPLNRRIVHEVQHFEYDLSPEALAKRLPL